MKLMSEDQILDIEFRKQVISEILGGENVARKMEARRRYEVYKDKTKKHVLERFRSQGLAEKTLALMEARASNISICKKIVNKKARCYVGGVERTVEGDNEDVNETATLQIQELAKLTDFNEKQKKGDRYRELYKNMAFQIVPEMDSRYSTPEMPKYNLKLRCWSPWQYDVIEDSNDREKGRVVILSDYSEIANRPRLSATESEAARRAVKTPLGVLITNRKDDIIADSPDDSGLDDKQEFIWWSDSYHFTTDQNGDLIEDRSPEDLVNPIGLLNFVFNSDDQDGQFWAEGGEDLIDGSILINVIITDMLAIAYQQGWGQVVITGKNLPGALAIGPHNALVFDVEDKDDPQPTVDVVNANPPLDSWGRIIEQYVALLLSTNNLSPASVSIKLDAAQFPSGVAMVIDQAEAVGDIQDQQEDCTSIEKQLWEILRLWHNLYYDKKALSPKFEGIGKLPDQMSVDIRFKETKPIISEKDKLEILEKRKNLGINEEIDLIMLDNPSMTREQAEEKLMRILEEKMKKMAQTMASAIGGQDQEDQTEDEANQDNEEDQNQDDDQR